jgi:hypothetical protein
VVYNVADRTVILEPEFVFGAMLGNLSIQANFDNSKAHKVVKFIKTIFGRGGKMTKNKNTTISAIIVLQEFLDNREVQKALKEEERKQGKEFTGPELTAIRMKLLKNYDLKRVPRVVIMENPYARIPLPLVLFCGPYDERWRIQNNKIERVFVGEVLKEIESLKEDTEA